jgi:hypothetical protein
MLASKKYNSEGGDNPYKLDRTVSVEVLKGKRRESQPGIH